MPSGPVIFQLGGCGFAWVWQYACCCSFAVVALDSPIALGQLLFRASAFWGVYVACLSEELVSLAVTATLIHVRHQDLFVIFRTMAGHIAVTELAAQKIEILGL